MTDLAWWMVAGAVGGLTLLMRVRESAPSGLSVCIFRDVEAFP